MTYYIPLYFQFVKVRSQADFILWKLTSFRAMAHLRLAFVYYH